MLDKSDSTTQLEVDKKRDDTFEHHGKLANFPLRDVVLTMSKSVLEQDCLDQKALPMEGEGNFP